MAILAFLWSVATLASFVPALIIIARNRRHFEYYVGCFQLVAGALYSASKALGNTPLLVQQHEWHFLADWLVCAYSCLLCIHLGVVRSEDRNIVLRYAAFTLTLLAKFRDAWEGAWNQAAVVALFAAGPICKYAVYGAPAVLNKRTLAIGLVLLGVSLVLLAGVEVSGRGAVPEGAADAVLGLAHMLGGATSYLLWSAVPCRDRTKKTDQMPSFV